MFTDYIAISIGCYCGRESLPKSVNFTLPIITAFPAFII